MKQKIVQWFRIEPKRLVILAVAALGILALLVSFLITETEEDLGINPVISLPQPQDTSGSNSLEGIENESDLRDALNLPSLEETLEGAARDATDHSMVLLRTYLGYNYDDSPRAIMNDLRFLVSDEQLEKILPEVRDRDWEAIQQNKESRIVEVTFLEIIEEKDRLPYKVRVSADIYEITGDSYPTTPIITGIWEITLEPERFSTAFTAINIEQVG